MRQSSSTVPICVAVAACLIGLVLAGCSSSKKSPSGSGPASSSPPASTTSPATSPAASGADTGAVAAALLTADDLGTGFAKVAYQPAPGQPEPCGQPGLQSKYPMAVRAGTEIDKGQTVQFTEAIDSFPDAATALAAFNYGVAGLDCRNGSISGTPVTIAPAQDVTSDVGGDQAKAYNVSLNGAKGVIIGVHSGKAIVEFAFLAASSVDTSALPNPIELAKAGTSKASSALA
jgi:hypothetical protein